MQLQRIFFSNAVRQKSRKPGFEASIQPLHSFPFCSQGDGVSFQTHSRNECELGVVRNGPAHLPSSGEIANGPTVSGDESEVEMFAAGDSERQPLTRTTEL